MVHRHSTARDGWSSQHGTVAHGLYIPSSRHPAVRRLRRQGLIPSLHGNKVWRSCFALMAYLQDFPLPNHANVIDIGCGWGCLSMYLAQQFNANVVGIDADASLAAYFALLAELNEVDTVAFQALRLETLTTGHFDGVHTVVGTDICFWDALVEPLFAMISAALDGGVRQILLSDPGRPPFWALAERCDAVLNCELLPQHSGAPFNTTKPILIIEP